MTVGSRPPKAAMLVAQRIVRDIVRGGLRPGDVLPPERAMLATYETGRGTLREALRLLEFQGVITLRPGPRGGPVPGASTTCSPGPAATRYSATWSTRCSRSPPGSSPPARARPRC